MKTVAALSEISCRALCYGNQLKSYEWCSRLLYFFCHFLSNESCITQVCVHNSFLNQHSIFLIIWPCVVRSEVLRYADLIVAVSSSLRSNILYISRRREIGGKNQCLSECKCDWLVGYVSTLHDWRNYSQRPRYFLFNCALFCEVQFVVFSSTAHRVETLRQLLRNVATGKKTTVACPSVVLNVGSEVNSKCHLNTTSCALKCL